MRQRVLIGIAMIVAGASAYLVSPGAAAGRPKGCGTVIVKTKGRAFVGDKFSAYQRVGCKKARLMATRFLAQGHRPTACENGCRVAYRWLCFYTGFHDRNGYWDDCDYYPQYPAVGFPAHPGGGFFFYERVR